MFEVSGLVSENKVQWLNFGVRTDNPRFSDQTVEFIQRNPGSVIELSGSVREHQVQWSNCRVWSENPRFTDRTVEFARRMPGSVIELSSSGSERRVGSEIASFGDRIGGFDPRTLGSV